MFCVKTKEMNKGGVFLNNYNDTIRNLDNIVYKPNNLMITNVKEEKAKTQNMQDVYFT